MVSLMAFSKPSLVTFDTVYPASDGYVQSYIAAGILRPILRSGLERGETLNDALPKFVNKWHTFAPH